MSKKREKPRGDPVESAASPLFVVAEPNGPESVTGTDDDSSAAPASSEPASSAGALLSVEPEGEATPPTSTANADAPDSEAHASPPSAAGESSAANDATALEAGAGSTDTATTSTSQATVDAAGAASAPASTVEEPRGRWGFASRALKAAKKLLLVDETPPSDAHEAVPIVADPHESAASSDVEAPLASVASTDAADTELSESAAVDPTTVPVEPAASTAGDTRAEPTAAFEAATPAVASLDLADAASADPSADAKPALCGHSSVLAVPEVLGLLATLHKSGTFSVWNAHDAFRIRLVRGTVVSAQATASAHQLLLGTILVDHGAIAAQTLTEFMEELAPERRLGDALVEAGLIERTTLESAVQYQAQRVFHAAYALHDAWYRFDVEIDNSPHERGLSVTHLLLESARMRDETEQRLDDVLGDPFPGS